MRSDGYRERFTWDEVHDCAMVLDGLDQAIVGLSDCGNHLVYSDALIVEQLIADQSWNHEEAMDWLAYNIHGLGPNTGGPWFVE
jgi:hypothetical protein